VYSISSITGSRISAIGNKYELYRELTKIDAELYGAINRISLVVRDGYKGIGVHLGHKLDEREEKLLRHCITLEKQFKLRDLFQSIAFNLLRDGDSVYVVDIKRPNVFFPLPMHALTIVESRKQLSQPDAQVFKPNIYVLNEGYDGESIKQHMWPLSRILHFSLNNRAEVVYDVMGRFTFGVWSNSPVESLRSQLLWKLTLRINDIILRQRLVPRLHHKLDLSAFDPNRFAGDTVEARIAAAKAAATTEINTYKANIAQPLKEVDQDFITGKSTDIGYVEPKGVKYVEPNALIDQINQSIYEAIGAHNISSGKQGRTYASELVASSFTTVCARVIADRIKRKLLRFIRLYIQRQYTNEKYTTEDLDKVDIRLQFLIGPEKSEAVRRAAVLSAMGIATEDELRDEVGLFSPLSKEDKERLIDIRRRGRVGDYTRTQDDVIGQFIRREEPERPETPESKDQRKETV